jgi:hypothetical protein
LVGGACYIIPDHPDRVYFIQGAKGSPIKIGFTSWDEVKYRVALLQTGNHEKLRLLCAAPGDRYFEKAIHRVFAADRLIGEWFTCTPALLALIKTLKTGTCLHEALTGLCPENVPRNGGI